MPTETTEDITKLIHDQVEEILAKRPQPFTMDDLDRLERLDGQVSAILADRSASRILTGPLWLSGASVVDATITADKLIVNSLEAITANMGTLNVTGTITAAASYPALTGARIIINSSEIAGYNSGDSKTFSFANDGSGFIGIGASQATWTTSGVLTVPAAAIGSLTIADVGSGTFNANFDAGTGRVRAGTALQRVEITSSGLLAYDTGGTNTFSLSAADGSLSHTGVHTIRNAASGARVELSNVGIRGFNSGGSQTFGVSTTDGSGFFGLTTPVTWNSSGTVVINGSLLVSSTVTADKINVSTLSAITANMGTITAGTISAGTVNATTITTGTFSAARMSGGSLGGGFSLGTSGVTLDSSGTIAWASGGSSISSSKVTIQSGVSYNSSLDLKDSGGTTRGGIYCYSSGVEFSGPSGGRGLHMTSTTLLYDTTGQVAITAGSGGVYLNGASSGATAHVYVYNNGDIDLELGDTGGADTLYVRNSSGTNMFGVNSLGDLIRPITNDSTALGSYYGRVPIYINGNLRYLGVYN